MISGSSSTRTYVPLELWSTRMKLSRRRSIRACIRDAIRSAITTSFVESRPRAKIAVDFAELDHPRAVREPHPLRPRDAPRRERRQLVDRFLPQELEDPDVLLLALDRQRIEVARAGAQRNRKQRDGLRRGDDLPALRELRHPRGDVDRVAVDVAVVRDHRAEMKSHVHRHRACPGSCAARRSGVWMSRAARAALIGGRVGRHHLVADRLDDASAVFLAHGGHDREAALHDGARFRVAQRFIEPGAAADVGEQDGEVGVGPDSCVRDATDKTSKYKTRREASRLRGRAPRARRGCARAFWHTSGRHAAAAGAVASTNGRRSAGSAGTHGRGRALSGRSDGRRRRHGPRVQGLRPEDRPHAGDQAAEVASADRRGVPRPVLSRGQGRRHPFPSEHRHRVRRGRGGQPSVPRDGVGGGHDARRRAEAGAQVLGQGGRRDRHPARPRARLRAQARASSIATSSPATSCWSRIR